MEKIKKALKARELSSLLCLVAMFLLVGVVNPSFLKPQNILLCFNGSIVCTYRHRNGVCDPDRGDRLFHRGAARTGRGCLCDVPEGRGILGNGDRPLYPGRSRVRDDQRDRGYGAEDTVHHHDARHERYIPGTHISVHRRQMGGESSVRFQTAGAEKCGR